MTPGPTRATTAGTSARPPSLLGEWGEDRFRLAAPTATGTARRRRACPAHSRSVVRAEAAVRDKVGVIARLARRERVGRRRRRGHLARVGEGRGSRPERERDQHDAERKKLPQWST